MKTKKIRIDKARKGMAVTEVIFNHPQAEFPSERMPRRGSRWPTITSCEYRRRGEGGEPTHYLHLSDAPGWSYCLDPGDELVVVDEGR